MFVQVQLRLIKELHTMFTICSEMASDKVLLYYMGFNGLFVWYRSVAEFGNMCSYTRMVQTLYRYSIIMVHNTAWLGVDIRVTFWTSVCLVPE